MENRALKCCLGYKAFSVFFGIQSLFAIFCDAEGAIRPRALACVQKKKHLFLPNEVVSLYEVDGASWDFLLLEIIDFFVLCFLRNLHFSVSLLISVDWPSLFLFFLLIFSFFIIFHVTQFTFDKSFFHVIFDICDRLFL